MKKDSRYVWYILDGLVFIFINIFLWKIGAAEIRRSLSAFDPFLISIFALGIWRTTDVITHESVTDFIRAPFMDKKIVEGKESWEMSEKGFRGFFGTLVSCNACMGVWVAMIIFYLFVFFSAPTYVLMVVVMMFTCLERFLSKIYNVLEKRG